MNVGHLEGQTSSLLVGNRGYQFSETRYNEG